MSLLYVSRQQQSLGHVIQITNQI